LNGIPPQSEMSYLVLIKVMGLPLHPSVVQVAMSGRFRLSQ